MKCCDCGWKLTLCSPNQYLYQVSVGSIQKLLKVPRRSGLTWPLPTEFDDGRLAALFYPQADTTISARHLCRIGPLSIRSSKRKGSPKQLLWEEYTQRYPNSCYSYSQFCDRYKSWCQLQKRSMRQIHKAGKALYRLLRAHEICPSCRRLRVRSVRRKSLSPCSVRPTTPLPRPPGPSHCRTGCKAMSVPLSFRRDTGTADPRQPQRAVSARLADTIPSSTPATSSWPSTIRWR